MTTAAPHLPILRTIGEIAKLHGVELHRVSYVIKSRGLRHTSRAGILRLYDEAAVAVVAAELSKVRRPRRSEVVMSG